MSKPRVLKTKMLFVMLLLLQLGAFAQLKTITGVVKDDKGNPLSKASITAKGAKEGVATKADGSFSISVPSATTVLVVTSSEFELKEVSIKDKTLVEVELNPTVKKLDEVVVQIGYQGVKAKDVTGAISTVKGEEVKNLATQDVATLLQGRVAGVDVVTPSGQPGAKSQITIRGVSSLNNPDPVYVIDGVIQANNNINPQDIESMSVLKDASAAAIYGASAAGGVIIVTTKRGKGSKPTVNFSARYGITTPKKIELLDKNDFVRYKRDIKDANYSNPNNAAEIETFVPIDWNDELYSNGTEENYSLSVSGASSGVNYFLSGVYNKQKGVFLENTSKMAGFRLNTDIKITNSIKIGEQLNVSSRNTVPIKTPIVSTPFNSQPVFTGPLYSDVPGTTWGIYPYAYPGFNAVSQVKTTDFEFPQTSFQGQVYLEAKLPVKYMTFKATFGYTSQGYENNLFQGKYSTNGTQLTTDDGTVQSHLYRNVGNYQQTLMAYILAYDHTWGKHTVNLLGGYEQYANKTRNLLVDLSNVLGTSYAIFPSSSTLEPGGQSTSGGYDPNGLVKSVFGRINYDLNKRYFVTATVRQDKNFTTFGPNNQAGVFPAISAGWNIDKELFFKSLRRTVNQLKLRGGYGELGNSNIGPYRFVPSYNTGLVQNYSQGGATQVAYTQEAIANKDVHWETTQGTNIGIDAQLFEGKIYFTIDWYNKRTKDLLYNVPVALSSGVPSGGTGFLGGPVSAGTFLENIGTVQNSGVDIALGYNNKAGKLTYSIGATGSFNKNKVLSIETSDGLPDGNNNYPYGTSFWGGNGGLTRTYSGYAFGQFWGRQSLGIIQDDGQLAKAQIAQPSAKIGDLMFADLDNNKTIDNRDNTIIGNPYPKFTYGLNITANWKQFDIAILCNGVMGVDLYNGVKPYEFESLNGSNVTSKVFETSGYVNSDGVANGVTKYPSVGRIDGFGRYAFDPNGNYTNASSYFVESASYFKLKNLQIGYSLPGKVLEKARFKTVRVYVMANNLLTITNYSGVDPELGSQYALLGLDVNGNVVGNGDGSASAIGRPSTSRGIDGPAKYPQVILYTVGLDLVF